MTETAIAQAMVFSVMYFFMDKILTKREKEILVLRYGILSGREMTQKEVADLLGISQSYISRLEKKIMVRLKKSIQNNV